MKRRACNVVVFLLLGAILNVAVAWAHWVVDSRDPNTGMYYCYAAYGCGWPIDSLKQRYVGFAPATLETSFDRYPRMPIWPGFAINTIFYAAVLWMVFAFPFVMRRRRRIKRGLCPACAYLIGASPVCTECGAAVPAMATFRERITNV